MKRIKTIDTRDLQKSVKNGAIIGFGSIPRYAGGLYMFVITLNGRIMHVLYVSVGGVSSSVGSENSYAQPFASKNSRRVFSSRAGHHPSSRNVFYVSAVFSAHSSHSSLAESASSATKSAS